MKSLLDSPRSIMSAGLVAVTVLALVAVTPTPASAAVPGMQFVTASTALNSTVYKSVTVSCPSGKQLVGGGYQLVGAPGSVVLDDFIPSANRLTVGAGEVVGPGEPADGTTQSWRIVATALCANPLPGLQVGSQTSVFMAGGVRSVEVQCPGGKQVVSAGASLSNGWGQVSIDILLIADNFVVAAAHDDEDGFSDAWSITAYAVCANPLPGRRTVIGTSTTNSASPKQATATCLGGQRALGVGWMTATPVEGEGQVLNTSANISGNGVTVVEAEDANGFGGTWNASAIAVCANA